VYSQNIAYGPTNKKAVPLLDKKLVADLPTAPQTSRAA
jgi:putative spermidine/putrescine transport system substrate-binding protein